MADTFTASNGGTVERRRNGRYTVTVVTPERLSEVATRLGSTVYFDPEHAVALREFFRADEDERLGRWRSTVDAAWTAAVDAETGWVTFRHEDGLREFMVESRQSSLGRWTLNLQRIAREYFDAHPEPKLAWCDAQPGEVWALKLAGSEEIAMRAVDAGHTRFWPIDGPEDAMTYGARSHAITAGRRIWPEDAS